MPKNSAANNRDGDSRGASFQRQAMILMVSALTVRVLGFLYRLPMTHIIGNKGNAYYAMAYNIYAFLLLLSSAGLPAAIAKLVSERIALNQYREAHKVFKTALVVASLMGAVFTLVLVLGAKRLSLLVDPPPEGEVWAFSPSYYSLVVLSPTILIVAVASVFRGYFQGMRNSVPTAISQVAEQLFNAVFSVILAAMLIKGGAEFGAAGGTAGTGIGAAIGLLVIFALYRIMRPFIARRMNGPMETRMVTAGTWEIAREIIRIAFPIIIGTAVFSLSNIVDNFLVVNRMTASGAFDADRILDLYGQLQGKFITITTLPVSISTAVATAAVPNIAAHMKLRDYETVNNKINDGIRLSMILSIPSAIGLTVLGGKVIQMLFPDYPDGGALMTFGSISIIFLAITQITTGMLQGTGKVHIPVLGAVAGIIVKIILDYVLIAVPSINIIGAVLATTACYIVAGAVDVYFLRKYTGVKFDVSGALIKPTFAAVIMGLFCYVAYYLTYYVCGSNAVSTILSIVLGAGLYFMLLVLTGGLEDRYLERLPLIGGALKRAMRALKRI